LRNPLFKCQSRSLIASNVVYADILAAVLPAFYSNGKIKPNRCVTGGKEEGHLEPACYFYHKKNWIPV